MVLDHSWLLPSGDATGEFTNLLDMSLAKLPSNGLAGAQLQKAAAHPPKVRLPFCLVTNALEDSSQHSNLGPTPGLQPSHTLTSGTVDIRARVASYESLTLSSSEQLGLEEKPPRLLVFSGGTAFNSVAGSSDDYNKHEAASIFSA